MALLMWSAARQRRSVEMILMQIVGKARLILFWDSHRAWLVWAHEGATWPMSAKDLIFQGLH